MSWTVPVTQPTGVLVTAAIWNAQVTDNVAYLKANEIGYDQITATVTVTSAVEAAGTTVITCAAHTFDGSPVIAEFFAPFVQPTQVINGQVTVCLFEGATELGRLNSALNPTNATSGAGPSQAKLRFTPTAAAHTYTVTAFQNGGNGTIQAGAGGTATYVPAFIRFTRV